MSCEQKFLEYTHYERILEVLRLSDFFLLMTGGQTRRRRGPLPLVPTGLLDRAAFMSRSRIINRQSGR